MAPTTTPRSMADDRNIAVGALRVRGFAVAEGVQRDAERSRNHAQRFEDADEPGGSDGAHADEAHIVAVDFGRRHVRDGNGGRINGDVAHVAADEPDRGHQHEVDQHAAGAKDQGDAQAHDVAEAQDEADGVEVEDHAMAIDQRLHHRHELEVQVLLPDVEGGDEEIVNRGDAGGLEQQLGLRAALLAGDQHLGDGRGFGKGQLAVLLAHEIAAQGNEEENAQAAAGQADEDGLHRMGVEVEDVERRKGEDGAGHHAAGGAADAGDDHVLQHGGAALVHARQADGQDGDGNCRFHSLADLQGRVGRSHAEDDAQQCAPEHRAPGDFRHAHAGGHQRHIDLTLFQRQIGVRGQGLGFEFRCSGGHEWQLPGDFAAAGIVARGVNPRL